MNDFPTTATAFYAARERADIARSFESDLLHTAIYDARENGLSIRQTANVLQVPKSTVARHWHRSHRCTSALPVWGNEDEYRRAAAAIWSHAPEELDSHIPFAWSLDDDGNPTVRSVPMGYATLRVVK